MPSQKQLAANRRNARRSTGPKSPEGKSASARNAITHGLLARDPVITGERYQDFAELQAALYADFQPAGESEESLVRKMATAQWKMERLTRVETALFNGLLAAEEGQDEEDEENEENEQELSPEEDRDEDTRVLGQAYLRSLRGGRDPFWRLARYDTMLQRTYSRALADLQRTRKIRAGQSVPASDTTEVTSTTESEIGFVSKSTRKPPNPVCPLPQKPAQTASLTGEKVVQLVKPEDREPEPPRAPLKS